jgi:hypothetical protein
MNNILVQVWLSLERDKGHAVFEVHIVVQLHVTTAAIFVRIENDSFIHAIIGLHLSYDSIASYPAK